MPIYLYFICLSGQCKVSSVLEACKQCSVLTYLNNQLVVASSLSQNREKRFNICFVFYFVDLLL